MNIAVIFAGGSGRRMKSRDIPKQFLLVSGKPIIVHTVEIFNTHPEIDGIVIACLESWIHYMEELANEYQINKVSKIVSGGSTGQLSIYLGLRAAAEKYGREDNIVLIHDGVRPLIDHEIITNNIRAVREHGSAITCAPTTETFLMIDDNNKLLEVPDRNHSLVAKAPQSFWLDDVLSVQEKAISEGLTNVIDTCTLMEQYGRELYLVGGHGNNIKITTQDDFEIFSALYHARRTMENSLS